MPPSLLDLSRHQGRVWTRGEKRWKEWMDGWGEMHTGSLDAQEHDDGRPQAHGGVFPGPGVNKETGR